jgi:hypothetical protein
MIGQALLPWIPLRTILEDAGTGRRRVPREVEEAVFARPVSHLTFGVRHLPPAAGWTAPVVKVIRRAATIYPIHNRRRGPTTIRVVDISAATALGGLLVGAGGVLVAGITVWLSYRERTKELRQRLYDKRVDAALAVAAAAFKAYDEVLDAAEFSWAVHDDDGELWGKAWKAINGLRAEAEQWSIVLDEPSNEALAGLARSAWRVSGYPGPNFEPPNTSNERVTAVTADYKEVVRALRQMLGVERLSEETLRLLEGRDRARPSRPQAPGGAGLDKL